MNMPVRQVRRCIQRAVQRPAMTAAHRVAELDVPELRVGPRLCRLEEHTHFCRGVGAQGPRLPLKGKGRLQRAQDLVLSLLLL